MLLGMVCKNVFFSHIEKRDRNPQHNLLRITNRINEYVKSLYLLLLRLLEAIDWCYYQVTLTKFLLAIKMIPFFYFLF